MNDHIQSVEYYDVLSSEDRNRVLRNTYWLLAVSMLPTVLGAWVGVASGISYALSGGLGIILMLAGAFGFIYAIEKTKHSSTGVYVLLGFTFFMGLMLSRMIAMVLGFKNGAELVMTAFGGTAGVFFAMASLSSVIKRDISGLGTWLMVGVIVLTAVKPITSAPHSPYTLTYSTSSKACWLCWVSLVANANKVVTAQQIQKGLRPLLYLYQIRPCSRHGRYAETY